MTCYMSSGTFYSFGLIPTYWDAVLVIILSVPGFYLCSVHDNLFIRSSSTTHLIILISAYCGDISLFFLSWPC